MENILLIAIRKELELELMGGKWPNKNCIEKGTYNIWRKND
jgi:hypothetical protein